MRQSHRKYSHFCTYIWGEIITKKGIIATAKSLNKQAYSSLKFTLKKPIVNTHRNKSMYYFVNDKRSKTMNRTWTVNKK